PAATSSPTALPRCWTRPCGGAANWSASSVWSTSGGRGAGRRRKKSSPVPWPTWCPSPWRRRSGRRPTRSCRATSDSSAEFASTPQALERIGVQGKGGGPSVREAVTPPAEVVSGLRSVDLRGKTPEESLPAAVAEQLTESCRACLRAEAVVSYEHELHLPQGP